MARVKWATCRKETKCMKCGTDIKKGDKYCHFSFYRQRRTVRCGKCIPRASELTQNERLCEFYGSVEAWDDAVRTANNCLETLVAEANNLSGELMTVAEMYGEVADRIMEHFPNGTTASEEAESARDEIESLADQINSVVSEYEDTLECYSDEGCEETPDEDLPQRFVDEVDSILQSYDPPTLGF